MTYVTTSGVTRQRRARMQDLQGGPTPVTIVDGGGERLLTGRGGDFLFFFGGPVRTRIPCLPIVTPLVTTKCYAIGYGRARVVLGRSNHFKTSTEARLQVSERLSIGQTFQTFCKNEMKYDGLVGPG